VPKRNLEPITRSVVEFTAENPAAWKTGEIPAEPADRQEQDSIAPRRQFAPALDNGWRAQREIADLAFEFWLERAFRDGSPEEDLYRATRIVRTRTPKRTYGSARLFLVRKPGP
jgi:hypothetical protein